MCQEQVWSLYSYLMLKQNWSCDQTSFLCWFTQSVPTSTQPATHHEKVNTETKTGLEEAGTKGTGQFTLQSHKNARQKADPALRRKTSDADSVPFLPLTETIRELSSVRTAKASASDFHCLGV